jgi:hypothetical protein
LTLGADADAATTSEKQRTVAIREASRQAPSSTQPALRDELRSFRVTLGGAFGGLLFPSPVDSAVAAQTDVLSGLLLEAEAHAKPLKLDGSLWHAYRRK